MRWPVRAFRGILCCLLAAAALAGCAAAETPSFTPGPAPTPMPYAPVGDRMAVRQVTQVMYFLSSDGTRLRHMLKTIAVMPGEAVIEAVMTQLMAVPEDPEYAPIFPEGTDMYVLSVEQSAGVATVNLTGRGFSAMSPFAQFAARAAIVNTLTELSDVRYVSVLVDGSDISPYRVSESAYLPYGVMARIDNISSAFSEMENLYARMEKAETLSDEVFSPRIALYFASPDGTMLLPEVREIDMDCSEMIRPIINALIRGPSDTQRSLSTLPAGLELQTAYTQRQGDSNIAVVEFRRGAGEAIKRSGIHPTLMYASLVHTLMTALPHIAGVRVQVVGSEEIDLLAQGKGDENEAATPLATPSPTPEPPLAPGEQEAPPELGDAPPFYTRADFSIAVGRDIILYFPKEDGRLCAETRVVPQREAASPRRRLRALLEGMEPGEGYVPLPFPESLGEGEILGIAMSGETALVNLSARAAQGFEGVSILQERAWLYALINTLTGMPGIKSVRFLVEGAPVDTLGGGVWLKEPLLANPGLVAM